MFKKILTIFTTVALISVTSLSFLNNPTYADDSYFQGRTGDGCQGFLGLTSWDCGVDIHDEVSLKAGVWQIVTNISIDLTIIAAYLVLGYVIYGGYLYMLSRGDPGKTATGKKALTQAFIGLAIVLLANIVMSTIRFILLGSTGVLAENCVTSECVNPTTLVSSGIQWIIAVAGIVCAIFVVYGGISYLTSAGDPSKLQRAKHTIMYALIGLVIVALAEIITAFVTNLINNSTSFTNETIIAKELNIHEINS